MEQKSCTVLCPCKVNLSLDILGTRPNGYHEMDMIMQTVSLCDIVRIKTCDNGIAISSNSKYMPTDGRNIAHKCAAALLQAANVVIGVDIDIKKRIPMQAGLGGGSSDGAGVLLGLNHILGKPLSMAELVTIGAKIGADIPFCLIGGTARVTGVGEVIQKTLSLPCCTILIAKPRAGASTKECFRRFDALCSVAVGSAAVGGIDRVLDGIKSLDLCAMAMFNVLEKAVDVAEVPLIKAEMLEHGAMGSVMSGSGSAVIGIFTDVDAAGRCRLALSQKGFFAVETELVRHGAKIIS